MKLADNEYLHQYNTEILWAKVMYQQEIVSVFFETIFLKVNGLFYYL